MTRQTHKLHARANWKIQNTNYTVQHNFTLQECRSKNKSKSTQKHVSLGSKKKNQPRVKHHKQMHHP